MKPDRCVDCPLLRVIPKEALLRKPKNSKKSHLCMGTMNTLTKRGIAVRASAKDVRHPWHRPCDAYWDAWIKAGAQFPVPIELFIQSRMEYNKTTWPEIVF